MDVEQAKAAILHLYETTRRGHLEGDAAKLLAQYGPRWDDLRDGTVVVRTIDEERWRVANHLADIQYLAWDDVTPPRVEVSPDGTMAWLLGEVRARVIQKQPDGSERMRLASGLRAARRPVVGDRQRPLRPARTGVA